MKKIGIILAAAGMVLVSACGSQEKQQLSIIPYPNSVEIRGGSFEVAGAAVSYSPEVDAYTEQAITGFAKQLSAATKQASEATAGLGQAGFVFELTSDLPAEAYEIKVTKKAVNVKASGLNGFLYAIETLKQMLPVAIYIPGSAPAPKLGRGPAPKPGEGPQAGPAPKPGEGPAEGPQAGPAPKPGEGPQAGPAPKPGEGPAPKPEEAAEIDWSLPCVTIKDAPRFGYRGQLIDVARHFYDVPQMKKVIDMMLTHKLNILHWHLTDDQGWRIEIDKYPRLTSVGSMRKGTIIRKNWDQSDGIPYGGYYTKDQIREVVEYAASKGITIIPEIDLPGHMLAALTAYPELGCTGGPYEVWQRWGVSDDVLCVGKEETMLFLEDVLSEVADLFPSEYFHIGGDECPKVRWENCPTCQAKIKELGLEDKEYSAEHYLQSYVMERMENFLATKGKKIIGWDEVLEGTLGPDATIMSWRGSEGGMKAAAMGHDAIMTPNSHFYFDHYQSADTDNEPFGIGGYLPLEKVYSYEPYTDEMDEAARAHIIGVQANLWTEYIKTPDHLEYMLLPRQAALSEVQWCQPENKDWDRFYATLPKEMTMYDVRGYKYSRAIYTNPDPDAGKE